MNPITPRLPERYSILAALGGGGGGNVFEVKDRFLDKNLALKLFSPSGDGTNDEDAFRAEFLLSASVSHPNLVRVFDFGYDGGNHPFFTMELANGGELSTSILFESESAFLENLRQVTSALGMLHHFGFQHNDLKPSNIRFESDGGRQKLKILDFGLAREYDPSRAKELGGTVEYMAPEIFQNGDSSPRSDIYGLGIILYELVTGRLPFSFDDPLETISGHVERELPDIVPVVSFFNEGCIAELRRMLDKNPEVRPQSMNEVFSGFLTALGGNGLQESVMPYFDTAILQQIRKTPMISRISRERQDNIRLACNDELPTSLVHTNVKHVLQTGFLNVRSHGDDDSLTSVHAQGVIDLVEADALAADGSSPLESFIINVGNYGVVPDRFREIPAIDGVTLILSSVDRIIPSGRDSALLPDVIGGMGGGNLAAARLVLQDIERCGLLKRGADGFSTDMTALDNWEPNAETIQSLLKQIDFLSDSERATLGKLSVLDHDFDIDLAAAILQLPISETGSRLSGFVEMRILTVGENGYRFREEALRDALSRELDDDSSSGLHLLAAEYLESNGEPDEPVSIGILSRHNLLGGNIETGIRQAVKYQKVQSRLGEFTAPESLLLLCDELYRASGFDDEKLESELLMSFGDLYKAQGKADAALEKYHMITTLGNVDLELLAETYKDLGDIHKSRMEYTAGIEALDSALAIYERIGDRLEISHTMNNMGNMHFVNSEYDLALDKYRAALDIQQELDVTKDIASTLTNMGSVYFMKREYSKAIEYFEQSIELKKRIDDQPEIARTFNNMAAAYHQMGESGRALNYLNQAMAINRQIGAQKEILFNLENIADTCICLGKYKRAEGVSAEGLALARQLGDTPHLGVFSTYLAQIYTERGLYGSALEFLRKSMEVVEQITDKPFTARTLLVLAKNYLLLNAPDRAGDELDRARRICSPIEYDDVLAKLKILTVQFRHSSGDDPEVLIKALDNIDRESEQRDYRHEQCESLLLRLGILSEQGNTSTSALEKLDNLTSLDQFAAFRGSLHYFLGVASFQDRAYNEALSHLEQAEVVAKALEQRELLLKVHMFAGRVCMARLEYEDAFIRLKQAGSILKEIARNVGDENLVKSYMSSADKIEIFDTVKRLTAKLA